MIDASKSKVIDMDVIEVIREFTVNAKRRNIDVDVVGIPLRQGTENREITEVIRK